MGKYIIALLIVIAVAVFIYWQNGAVGITKVSIKNHKIPRNFNGYKILQISDFHNSSNWKKILKKVKSCDADIAVFTGDIIDRRDYKLDIALDFVKNIDIPCYFVSGNHEAWLGDYENIITQLEKLGVIIMDDKNLYLQKGESHINLIGIKDPGFLYGKFSKETPTQSVDEFLPTALQKDTFNLVLSHRPEIFPCYCKHKADYVMTGHAHGGQFRFPVIGGLYAPGQGIFPKYHAGIYQNEQSTMYLSRGVGKSKFPFRLFNPPELVLFSLESEKYR